MSKKSDTPRTPTLLNKNQHEKLKLLQPAAFPHAARQHLAPLGLSEFEHAAANYPLIIVKDENTGKLSCVAMLGLTSGQNLFYTDTPDGAVWNATYVPFDIRRYPFSLGIGENAEQADGTTRYDILITEDPAYVSATADGQDIFAEDGTESDLMKVYAGMLKEMADGLVRADALAGLLADKKLIREFALELTLKSGKKQVLTGLYTPDQEAIGELDDADIIALTKNGALGIAHILKASLAQINRLVHMNNAQHEDPIVTVNAGKPQSAL